MTPQLPIQLPAIPDPAQSFDAWRTVERTLAAIAAKEEANENLYRSEKIAYNAIAYARWQASKRQWSGLWQYLLDRQILAIGEVSAPPPKPPKPTRPTKPPKAKIEKPVAPKVAKPERLQAPPKLKPKKKRRSPIFLRFKKLKRAALRLQVFLWFADWVASTAPKCKARSPIKNRPDGERIKTLLSYKAKGGYASLKLYLPKSKKRYRMNGDVIDILLKWSNPKRERSEVKIASDKAKGEACRLIPTEIFNQALSDKWQDTGAICAKLNVIADKPITLAQSVKILNSRLKTGEVHQLKRNSQVYYSLVEATEFETEWINLSTAYEIAVSRGCTAAYNTFRKTYKFNYAKFGLEFRKEVPEHHNSLLRWRDINHR